MSKTDRGFCGATSVKECVGCDDMKTKPVIVVPAYGDWKVWSPRLGTFLRSLRAHEPDRTVILISDGSSNWPPEACHGLKVEAVATANTFQTWSNLNMNGILLAYAAIRLAPCLVMTMDCLVCKPLEWGAWTETDLAFCRDIPARRIREMAGHRFEELSVAVAWFGLDAPGWRFLTEWRAHGQEGPRAHCNFWEQVVWSYVWDRYPLGERALYPVEMNWSHTVPGGDPIVVHYHGLRAKEAFDWMDFADRLETGRAKQWEGLAQ